MMKNAKKKNLNPTKKKVEFEDGAIQVHIEDTDESCDHIYIRDVQSCLSLCSKLQTWKKSYCVIYYLYNCPYCNDANHEINTCFQEFPNVCWIKCEVSNEKEMCKQMIKTETFPAIRVFNGVSIKSLFEYNRSREDYLEFFNGYAEKKEEMIEDSGIDTTEDADSKIDITENQDSVKCVPYTENMQYPCIIFIYANWCGHCVTTKPNWNEAVEEMEVTPYAISDQSPELLEKFEVKGFPTIIGFDKNKNKHDFPPEKRTTENLLSFSKSLI